MGDTAPQLLRDIELLTNTLDATVAPRVRDSWERSAPPLQAARDAALAQDEGPDHLAALSLDDIAACVKLLITRFHLRNNAEQVHIVRVNRERSARAAEGEPRPESIDAAVAQMRADGLTAQQARDTFARLDIAPTLTAHPTEVRRQSIVRHQATIARCLHRLDRGGLTPSEDARTRETLSATIALLGMTDEVRFKQLDPLDEVRNGIGVLSGAIWQTLPVLARDVRDAIARHYPDHAGDGAPSVPVRYRSWIGGDRDGNPNVDANVTRETLALMRESALRLHHAAIDELDHQLSVSNRAASVLPDLAAWRASGEAEQLVPAYRLHHLDHEPWRVKLRVMGVKLLAAIEDPSSYSPDDFRADLALVDRALRHAGLTQLADASALFDARVRAEAFGFHLAAIDIRQHSGRHADALAELFKLAGACDDYAALDEPAKLALLERELAHARPLAPRSAALSEGTRRLLDTLDVVAQGLARDSASIRSYIVSMTHEVSDLLAVLVLLKEAGLLTDGAAPLDVVPLFETVDDLDRAPSLMRELFASPAYRAHLEARGRFQEIMLGYSDSNKDGGYWMASWRLHSAQHELAQTCADAGVDVRFFHGRGGSVARGGGRAGRAIRSTPASARNGRIRFTEQGEVISFRYATPEIARRHLEQIVHAMALTTAAGAREDTATPPPVAKMMDDLAAASMEAYRALVDDPAFWDWYTSASPVLAIGSLKIASRPVVRPGKTLSFENIRAIPWVFGWTQMRANVPGWYGIGAAFEHHVLNDPARLAVARDLYKQGGWLATFIDNAQQEMARARLPIARVYRAKDGERFHTLIAEEFARAERAILAITGQDRLLDNNPVIQRSIDRRNPDTDLLNLLQAELLRRSREATSGEERDALSPVIQLAVNALAAAMQSTG